ncbi:hypothetical protein MBLNU13_g01962t2 [Cladosporium sp. NU13]
MSLSLATALAIPAAVFPFNSQVPTAARVDQPYLFQFSSSTFVPGDANLVYSLSGQPAWLSLDSASRTLSGTPGHADTGSSTFTLTAADSTGAAHMHCTLVVVSDPIPTLQGDLGEQLAASANLSSSNPPVMTLLPGSAFNFHFRRDSFIDIVRQRGLYYYATLADHTPLPAWLHFDAAQLTFEGVAPTLGAFPQSFEVMLIASDVPGFAGSSWTFTIRIGERQLVFVPEERDVRLQAGEKVDVEDLANGLLLNGKEMNLSKVKSAEAKGLPEWLEFDSKTLGLQGEAPDDVKAVSVTVTISDENGDTAMVVLHFVLEGDSKALFTGSIGTLDATPGEHFEYTIPTSVISDQDATLMLILPADATWLEIDSGKRELKGDVPTQASTIIAATLTAKAQKAAQPESQIFSINVKAVSARITSATTLITSRTAPTASSTSPPVAFIADSPPRDGLPGRTIAGIVVGVILAVAILFAILFLCCCKRRAREGFKKQGSPSKQSISRPIPPIEANSIAVTTELQRDVEKAGSVDDEGFEEVERPPQLDLNLPPQSARNSRWTSRFSRNSLASSLGNGEDMIRADANIPEWGHESTVLQTPHDSFSVPAQMARVSRQLSDLSPSKRALRRLRAKKMRHQSEDDVGLGIGLGGASLSPRREASRRKVCSLGLEATLERSSCVSLETEATSVLNMQPLDFPRPPTHSSFGGSRSALGATDKRKSVRLVARSDSINDERSLEEKRQSFIRKRASTTLSSPLWSASLGVHRGNGHGSSTDIDAYSAPTSRRSKRDKSQLTSYSESSSIQPTRSSNRLSQRIHSTFAPNFPRAITKSTLADNDDWETSSESSSSAADLDAEMELADEMALPRHERSWVLPNEASPTPPPTAPPSHRQPSSHRASTPNSVLSVRRPKPWTTASSRSISPLASQALDNASTRASLSASAKASRACRSRLSEPMALASTDSLSKVKAKTEVGDRPRLAHTRSGRPVSVEDVQRLSSLRAERVEEQDVGAGAKEGDGRERVVTDGSGKAFI